MCLRRCPVDENCDCQCVVGMDTESILQNPETLKARRCQLNDEEQLNKTAWLANHLCCSSCHCIVDVCVLLSILGVRYRHRSLVSHVRYRHRSLVSHVRLDTVSRHAFLQVALFAGFVQNRYCNDLCILLCEPRHGWKYKVALHVLLHGHVL